MISLFCLEVKQKNRNPYTPKSILQILTNLQSYAHTQDPESFPFMNQKDVRIKHIHDVVVHCVIVIWLSTVHSFADVVLIIMIVLN